MHEPQKVSPSNSGQLNRREFLRVTGLASLGGLLAPGDWTRARLERTFGVCLSPEAVLEDPGFPTLLKSAGVSRVWLAAYFYGYWPWPFESLALAQERLHSAGLDCGVVNVPLGHPGDSLGAKNGEFPLTPPPHWRQAVGPGGESFCGTSLHAPATAENCVALQKLRAAGFRQVFLDDDFRLARGPGLVGGCFCDAHKQEFLKRTGFKAAAWEELLADAQGRRLTRVLREWVEFTCDSLGASFRAQRRALRGDLGIMVMYLGAEKAGIRLRDYQGVPFRVGELMFDDASFAALKGKTNELFSVLFHRRFARPELAYSETTAYPADKLSAENLGAKLVISTIADVRQTLFMSGVTPFPKSHWGILGPKIARQAALHRRIAGHTPRGPLKHYWGETSRFCGDDNPFSIFLASGIPFEVTERPAKEGWTFLSDADAAAAAAGTLVSRGTRFVARPGAARGEVESCAESWEAVARLKTRLAPGIPYVETDAPAVLAWYPTARAALLWNVGAEPMHFRVRCGTQVREISVAALDAEILPDLPCGKG